MAWRLRRRERDRELTGYDIKAYYGYRPGSWGEIALPPRDEPVAARRYDVSLDSRPLAIPRPRVRLGFTDGTEVELDSRLPDSQQLSRIAATLTEDGPTG